MSSVQLQALETKTRDILKRSYRELPVAKDLPRLAKRITILSSKGATILQPADATPSGPYVKEIFTKLFEMFQESELIPKLEEGWEACFDEKKELEKVLDRLLAVYIPGDSCKSLRILKACNQGVISGAVLELKFALGIAHTTKDVPNSWFFTIRNGSETTTVTSTKREICVQGVFEFQWEFTLYFNTHTQEFRTISLKVTDLVFHKPENTQKMEEVKRILSKYMKTDILLGIARDRHESRADEINVTAFLLPGEKILLQSEDVEFFTHKSKKDSGIAYITNYRIHFVPQPNKRKELKTLREELSDTQCTDIPLASIHKLKNQDVVKLWCKDLRIANFQFKEPGPKDSFFVTTKKYTPATKDDFFSSTYFANGGVSKSASSEGWRIYNPLKELERLALPADRWRISNINTNFALCPGYPTVIAVPQSIMDEELIVCGQSRDGRIPTPVFKHPLNGAYLCRAQTPSKKSAEDDKYIEALQKANSTAFFNIELTEVKSQTPRNRSGSSLKEREEILPLESISSLQESYQDLALLCYDAASEGTDESWLSALDKTKWLQQIQTLLSAASRIVELLEKGFPVLLQSEFDTDRIPQITSLVQLLLDPYFRTLNGFEILIEKEWMCFGHKFLKRGGFLKNKKDTAPLFLQFLDAVWQISMQFPKAFEFNSQFLAELMSSRYSGLYGTFLSNSNQERISLAETTASLWSYFGKTDKIADYLNGNYSTGVRLLVPSSSLKKLNFWCDYYLRWIPDAKSLSRAAPRTTTLPGWNSLSSLPTGLTPVVETPRELRREPSFSLDGIEKLTSKQMAKFKELQSYIEYLKKENEKLQRKERKRKEKYEKLKSSRSHHGSLKKERSYTVEDPRTPTTDRSKGGSQVKTSEAFPGISLHGDDDFETLVKRSPSKRTVPTPTSPR